MIKNAGKWRPLVLLLAFVVVLGFSASEVSAAASDKKVQIKVIENEDNAASSHYDFETQELVMTPASGYVEIMYEETEIKSLEARINQKEEKALLSGEVNVKGKDYSVSGETIILLLGDEIYTVEGNAHFTQDDKITIDAVWLEIVAATKDVRAKGSVVINDKNRQAWADELLYSDADQLITLIGNVRIEESDNNMVITGQKVVINQENDKMTVYGPWEAEVLVKEEESTK